MSYEEKGAKEQLEKKDSKGARIVVFGALASMLLWFTVLLSGVSDKVTLAARKRAISMLSRLARLLR